MDDEKRNTSASKYVEFYALYTNANYGDKEDWRALKPEAGKYPLYPVPLWTVDLFYYVPGEDQARFVAGYLLDEDGTLQAERGTETRIFKSPGLE